jgi:coenzyme F420-reducing hydrogenase gamma subunit
MFSVRFHGSGGQSVVTAAEPSALRPPAPCKGCGTCGAKCLSRQFPRRAFANGLQ